MFLNASPFVLFKYWIFQGLLYMNWVERAHRLTVEILMAVLIYTCMKPTMGQHVLIALLIAHSLSFFFNGHPFAVFAHDVYWFSCYKDPDRFLAYVEEMSERLRRKSPRCIREVLVFGSITRGVFRESSDLDVRYMASAGLWNGLLAAHYVFVERLRASFSGFPIDAYMFRNRAELEEKMRVDSEPAIILYASEDAEESFVTESRQIEDLKGGLHLAKAEKKPPRVLLIVAGGGHLSEGLMATNGIPIRRAIATHRFPHTIGSLKGDRCYFIVDPHGNLVKYALNFVQSFWAVIRERPDVVISTGGGMTISACLLGKLLGAKLIYVESGARVDTPSRTGDFLYRYADLFLVQWRSLLKRYPKAIYGGPLP